MLIFRLGRKEGKIPIYTSNIFYFKSRPKLKDKKLIKMRAMCEISDALK